MSPWGSDERDASDDMYFPTKCGAQEIQNPQNHRVLNHWVDLFFLQPTDIDLEGIEI